MSESEEEIYKSDHEKEDSDTEESEKKVSAAKKSSSVTQKHAGPEPTPTPAKAAEQERISKTTPTSEVDQIGKEGTDLKGLDKTSHATSSSEEVHTSSTKSSTSFGSFSASKSNDLDVDKEYTSRLLSSVNEGGFKSSNYPALRNVSGSSSSVTHTSQVLRKGFDIGLQSSSPGLRMLYETRLKELEEELEAERSARFKSEKQRAELQRDLVQAAEKLDEAKEALQKQVEQMRKRETDFHTLQRESEDAHSQIESQLIAFRKKHQEAVAQLTDQLDAVHKAKQRTEKDKHQYQLGAEDLKSQVDRLNTAKIQSEKQIKTLDGYNNELNQKLTAAQKEFSDIQGIKSRVQGEKAELVRRLEDSALEIKQINNAKQLIVKQMEELKTTLREEAAIRTKLISDNRGLQTQLEQLRDQLNDEREAQADLQKQLTKAVSDGNMWHQKFQSNEGNVRVEELEEIKKKMAYRVQDVEAQLEATVSKVVTLEKARSVAQSSNESLMAEIEKLQADIGQNEKRQKQFDKSIEEWKQKVKELQAELETSQKNSKSTAAELSKANTQIDESKELAEGLRRENKNLSAEVNELTDQLSHVNQRMLEVEKVAKRFETEKHEIQVSLEDAELAVQREEGRVQKTLLDVGAAREEMERRMMEKEEEFENMRKNHQKAIETMQSSLEEEARNKVETVRMKKKLEQNINDLELALDRMTKSKAEVEKIQKKYQQQILDLQTMVEEEQRKGHKAQEEFAANTTKYSLLSSEVADLKHQLEGQDKIKKTLEGDLHEATQRITELGATNLTLTTAKKQLETDFHIVQVDNEEQSHVLSKAEEQVRKLTSDANRMTDELEKEQNRANEAEKQKRTLEVQIKDLQARLQATELMAVQGGKAAVTNLELRVRELEVELEGERQRHAEREKTARKHERRMQDMMVQLEDSNRAQERMHEMIDKLSVKLKTYKAQLDAAEEVSASNLAKYRKIQHDLEETETRADLAEKMVEQMRNKSLSTISVSESVSEPSSGFTLTKTTKTHTISSVSGSKK